MRDLTRERSRHTPSADRLVRALWAYERGRLPLTVTILGRGIAVVREAGGDGLVVVLEAPGTSPVRPARVAREHVRALESLGWTRRFLVLPSAEGGRARLVGPGSARVATQWDRLEEGARELGGGRLVAWFPATSEQREALDVVLPGLRRRLGDELRGRAAGGSGARRLRAAVEALPPEEPED